MIKEGCVKGYYLHLVYFLVLIGQPWWSYLILLKHMCFLLQHFSFPSYFIFFAM
jgi:hypothetical protein